MVRLISQEKGGFYEFPPQYLPAVASLCAPSPHGGRILDPCAGEGAALAHLADAWHLEPYANELDTTRAAECCARFGPQSALQGDLYHLRASHQAFSVVWCNPPYTPDQGEDKRREFAMLKECWKWAQPSGGYVFWIVYGHHLSLDAALFLARHSAQVDLWRIPGLHLDAYTQIVAVCRTGAPAHDPKQTALALFETRQHNTWRMLTPQATPLYAFAKPAQSNSFQFAPSILTAEHVQAALARECVHNQTSFQALLAPPVPPAPLRPIVQPRAGQLALVLAAGLFNGLVLPMETGPAAVRSTLRVEENLAETEYDEDGEEKREVFVTQQLVTVTLLSATGVLTEVVGDDALVAFIRTHQASLLDYINRTLRPRYTFDYRPIAAVLAQAKQGRLYETQRHIIAACWTALNEQRGVLVVGEMGCGKSAIGATLAAALYPRMHPADVVILTCPPHLVAKWEREIHDAAPGLALTRVLKTVDDVRAFMELAEREPARLKIGLLSRESAKLGEGWRAAAVPHHHYYARFPRGERPKGDESPRAVKVTRWRCPTCSALVESAENVPATAEWLARQPRTCKACGGALWQNTRTFSAPAPGARYPKRNPRVPLAEYLAKRYPGRIYLYLIDEVHENKATSSDQGEAMLVLASAAQKVVGLTGTAHGGNASSLYVLEFVFNPRVRTQYPWGGGGMTAWVRTMGCLERVIDYKPEYNAAGAYTGKRRVECAPREIPGCSPALVGEILDHTVWLSLRDIGRALPSYTELPTAITPDADIVTAYEEAQAKLLDYLADRRQEGDNSALGMYLQALLSWPTAPWRTEQCIHRRRIYPHAQERLEILVHTIPALDATRLFAKEAWLVDTVRAELAEGRGVAVFVRQTGTRDIQPRLAEILRTHITDAHPFILTSSVEAARREAVLERAIKSGNNVLICNPRLVQTGLDLLAYPALCFFECEYSLYVMAQAARRAWRLTQTQACRTYYPYYQGLMEHRAVQLIGSKQSAANLLYGETSSLGLSTLGARTARGTLLAELAATLDQQGGVSDLRTLFAQHAHSPASGAPADSAWAPPPGAPMPVVLEAQPRPIIVHAHPFRNDSSASEIMVPALVNAAIPAGPGTQLSLF